MGTAKGSRQEKDRFNFADLAKLEDELNEVKRSCGIEKPDAWWQRMGDTYFLRQESRIRHIVSKKTYLLLTVLFGWAGFHRFYEKRWKLGLFYLLFCWTGFPAALAIGDFLIALPVKPDENGGILI